MKDYLKYLTQNPSKIALIIAIILFGGLINLAVNNTGSEFNLSLSIGVALFSILLICLILLQIWGEYRGIEGFLRTIKQLFKK